MDVEEKINKTVEEGGILALLYFDVHAKDKEKLVNLAKGFVKEIIHKPGVVMALGEIEEPLPPEEEGKNWSTYVTVKVLTRDFKSLFALCMAHSPFNVEILKPQHLKLDLPQLHDILATASAITAEYKKYIVTKLASPQELAQIEQSLKRRAEMGKKVGEDETDK